MQSTHLREHNLSAILRALAAAEGPISRAGLAAATGLTKPTVSKQVEELIDGGLIAEGTPVSMGAGRPMVPLRLAEGTLAAIGLEVTADHLSCLALDLGGRVLVRRDIEAPLAQEEPSRAVEQGAALVREVLAELGRLPVAGLVVAVPGRIAPDDGRVLSAPNLTWEDVPYVRELVASLKEPSFPVSAQNDNRLSVLTELDARPGGSFLYVRGSTGVGGAVVLGGEVLDGAQGWAGEFGHTVVVPDGELCRCGRRGCLEAYISRHSLAQRAGLDPDVRLEDLVDRLAASRDRAEVIGVIGRSLGLAVANALNVLDLETVVLSGYLAPIAEEITPVVRETVQRHALAAEAGPIAIDRADSLADPALHGAARAALAPVFADPGAWMARGR